MSKVNQEMLLFRSLYPQGTIRVLFLFVCFLACFVFEIISYISGWPLAHQVAKAAFELVLFSPAPEGSECYHICLYDVGESNPGLRECRAITLPTEICLQTHDLQAHHLRNALWVFAGTGMCLNAHTGGHEARMCAFYVTAITEGTGFSTFPLYMRNRASFRAVMQPFLTVFQGHLITIVCINQLHNLASASCHWPLCFKSFMSCNPRRLALIIISFCK